MDDYGGGQYGGYAGPPAPREDASPMQLKDWLITLLITMIPCVGIIMLFIWAFGSNENLNRKNFAKAQLVITAIGIVLLIIFYVIMIAGAIGFANLLSDFN
jgi:cell division protein FtsW (lipid II flippase)